MGAPTKFTPAPDTASIYAGAIKKMLPVVGVTGPVDPKSPLPRAVTGVNGVVPTPEKVAAYCQVTGARFGEVLPLNYVNTIGNPLMMALLVRPDFPLGAIGSVHIENTIEQYRPILMGQAIDARAHVENLREHPSGVLVDVVSEFWVGTEKVARQVSTLLRKQKSSLERGPRPEKRREPRLSSPVATLSVGQREISAYAKASGDFNPIHVSKIGAKAFGFPSTIAHGMWTAAAALAPLEGSIPAAARYSVAFAKPVVLPAKIGVWFEPVGQGRAITVRNPRKGTVHLTGTLTAL